MRYLTKRLGQHILKERKYLQKIIEVSDLASINTILEIGAGPGNLTELLIKSRKKIIAVEIDKRFCAQLREKFADTNNFVLVEKDALRNGKLIPQITTYLAEAGCGNWALISNLPYNIASTVIIESLFIDTYPAYISATIQKEVAKRITAKPNTKEYSPISVLVQALSDPKIILTIPPGAFFPPPKVESSIIKITYNKEKSNRITDKNYFRRFTTKFFLHRRKTTKSGFINKFPLEKHDIIKKTLSELNIDLTARPESLPPDKFIQIAEKLKETNIEITL